VESRSIIAADGTLSLSQDQARRWGLTAGVEVRVTETPEGLFLRRADPALHKVYVEPTTLCNLACRTCVRNAWDEPMGHMAPEIYERLMTGLGRVPSLQKVAFWGFGEPLLHPNIVEMVAQAHALGARTELITNGLLLNPDMAHRLIDAGLDTVVVSVDGVSDQAYADVRVGAELGLVRRNLDALRDIRRGRIDGRPDVGLEFVAMRSNLAELPHLPRLAASLGASHVIVTNLLPYTEDMTDEILYNSVSLTGPYLPQPSELYPEIRLPRMDARGPVRQALSTLLRYSGMGRPHNEHVGPAYGYCRFVNEGTVAVAWDGRVSPCIPLLHSYRCYILGREKEIKGYAVGHLAEQDIDEIWRQANYATLRDRVQRFDFSPCATCGGCEMNLSNEEDCLGNTWPVCGDCLWAQGVIQCP
jgi:MoaA/NifB/PqqE/SkfB family radical SAM enzyme